MTKQAALDHASADATIAVTAFLRDNPFTSVSDGTLVRATVEHVLVLTAVKQAGLRAGSPNATAYTSRFVGTFMTAWWSAYNAQPDVFAARRVERMREWCHDQERMAKSELDKFTANLMHDRWDAAAYAFEWADNACEAAARVKVARRLLAWYETSQDLDAVLKEVRETVERGARFPKRSTSPLTNHMAQCELSAFAAVLDSVK